MERSIEEKATIIELHVIHLVLDASSKYAIERMETQHSKMFEI